MNKFLKGLSYTFHRNIGKTDRKIRMAFSLVGMIAGYKLYESFTYPSIVLGVFSVMILGTAIVSKCGFNYWLGTSTISKEEKRLLDSKGIIYEN